MRTLFALLIMGATVIAPAMVAVRAAESTPAPLSPDAKDYLDRAITLFREQHINSRKMDWPALTQKAYAAAAGAKTTADTYPAIQLIIKELGEKHTSFVDPDHARAEFTGKKAGNAEPPPLLLPETVQLANGIGAVRLSAFMGSPEEGELYAQAGRTKIDQLKAQSVCKFVLDLRSDAGGNMYPMISSVAGLLRNGVLGRFESSAGKYMSWELRDGKVIQTGIADAPTPPLYLKDVPPVAVLIGPSTASAGEFTAMSFEGRPNTHFFGAPSAGYVTANQPIHLSDGAVIGMTVGWGLDRTGKKYVERIVPDQETGAGGPTEDAAVKWLAAQPCPSTLPKPSSAKRH